MPPAKRTRSPTNENRDTEENSHREDPTTPTPSRTTHTRRQSQTGLATPNTTPRPILTRSATIHLSTTTAFTPSTRRGNAPSFPSDSSLLNLPGPSRLGGSTGGVGVLTRTQSSPVVGSPSNLKALTGAGAPGGSGRGKGDPDFGAGPSGGRKWGRGKENIPPKKDDENDAQAAPRKRLRVGSGSNGRGRSGSVSSLRSEATSSRASLGAASSLSRIGRLRSPSPSPSSATSRSFDSATSASIDGTSNSEYSAADVTPTKPRAQQVVNVFPTPPPSSPSLSLDVQSTTERVELLRMQSFSSTASVMTETDSTDVFMEDPAKKNPYKVLKTFLRLSSGSDASSDRAVVGRDLEKAAIRTYLAARSDVGMYVSGPPGTGKTATVTALGRDLRAEGWTVIEIGCMGRKVADMWALLACELGCEKSEEGVQGALAAAAKTLVILDEIDSLLPPPPATPPPATSHLLTKLFRLPGLSEAVKLIAISNTLDLTLRANLLLLDSQQPQVLPFKAYAAPDMVDIVNARLALVGPEGVKADGKAIELLTRKVEAQNGDLRMCLGCFSSAVSLAEAEWLKKCQSATTADDVPLIKVGLGHTIKAFNSHTQQLKAAAGSSNAAASTVSKKIRSVQLQGKMVLAALLVFTARARAGLPGLPSVPVTSTATSPTATPTKSIETLTPGKLYATYTHLLSHKSSPFPPSAESDYRDLLSNLEVLGLVSLPGGGLAGSMAMSRSSSGPSGRGARGGKVELLIREEELREGLGLIGGAAGKGLAEEEVANIWEREEGRILRAREKQRGVAEGLANGMHGED